MDKKLLEKYDKMGMYKIYDNWPKIARCSYEQDLKEVDYHDIDHIVFAGMGGSGTIGDIFSSILSKENVHVCVVKGYHLPKTVDRNTLVVTTSISGNTIETLTVLDAARKTNCMVLAFSSGGKMEDYCLKNKIDYRKVPQLHSPRASFTGFLYSMLKVLYPVLPLKIEDIKESLSELEKTQEKISSNNLTADNLSLSLAEWITGVPIIYYPWGLQAAAIRFKNSLQENSKIHAMTEDVIEASHNGIMAWEIKSNIQPILLQGRDDYVKTKERWKIIREYFEKNDIDYKQVFSVKGSILTKLINLIYHLDYSTIYRAVLSGIDPTPVGSINFIKEKTKQQNSV